MRLGPLVSLLLAGVNVPLLALDIKGVMLLSVMPLKRTTSVAARRMLAIVRNRASKTTLACAIVLAWIGETNLVQAQEFAPPSRQQVVVPAEEFQALQQRLLDTERRLKQLETRRLPAVESDFTEQPTSLRAAGDDSSDDDDLQKRLEAVEKDLKKRAEADAKKKADDAKKPTLKWSGRIHADYWTFPEDSPGVNAFETGDDLNSPDDRFLFRRVRFGLQGDIPDNMLYKAEFDINQPQTPQFKDCYIGWTELPVLRTLLLGNQKRPYGLDHLNSSRYNVFLERPFIVEAVNSDARRFGLCSYGVSDDEAYNWRFGTYMMQDMQQLGTVFVDPVTEDYQAEVAGRFANTIWYDEASDGRGYAHWAVSGTLASPSGRNYADSQARFSTRPEARTTGRWIDTGVIVGTDSYEMVGLEGLLNLGPLQIVGEYQNIWLQRESNGPDLRFDGSYVYVAYFLTGESMAWERMSGTLGRMKPFQNFWIVDTCDDGVEAGWGAWQVAARYSQCDFNDDNITGGEGKAITVGLNWYWNAYAHMQVNFINGEIEGRSPVDGQSNGHYSILGTRFCVDY